MSRGETTALTARDAERLQSCLAGGGVAVFPTDTVYGLACDPSQERAVRRLYQLKGRPADRPAAVMFFERERATTALSELKSAERRAIEALLPGPVTLLLPNREGRFPLACGPAVEGRDSLGLRVPVLGNSLAALSAMPTPVMQSSANVSGGPEARRLGDVPREVLLGADLALDGGELPGTASTIVDLRDYERSGAFSVVREGAMSLGEVERALA
jgi:L-threonylcarbamoyladenylate synthase